MAQASSLFRFALLLVLSITLMIFDHRSEFLKPPVRVVNYLFSIPVEAIVWLPRKMAETLDRFYLDRLFYDELQTLEEKQAVLDVTLQRYHALEAENRRLTRLLSVSRQFTDKVLLSKIVTSGGDPYTWKIVVNRGVESGVFEGQPALSPEGVLGQVTEVGYQRSVITLIVDPGHGLPVEIERNGLRTIALGAGRPNAIKTPYLENEADVRQGDVLITSGLGGRFPPGYKVARITDVVKDVNTAFMEVAAETIAKIDLTRDVLLLWNRDQLPQPADTEQARDESH